MQKNKEIKKQKKVELLKKIEWKILIILLLYMPLKKDEKKDYQNLWLHYLVKKVCDQTPHWSPEVWLEASRTYMMELFRKNSERLFFSYFI